MRSYDLSCDGDSGLLMTHLTFTLINNILAITQASRPRLIRLSSAEAGSRHFWLVQLWHQLDGKASPDCLSAAGASNLACRFVDCLLGCALETACLSGLCLSVWTLSVCLESACLIEFCLSVYWRPGLCRSV